jgi:hypothetical protein
MCSTYIAIFSYADYMYSLFGKTCLTIESVNPMVRTCLLSTDVLQESAAAVTSTLSSLNMQLKPRLQSVAYIDSSNTNKCNHICINICKFASCKAACACNAMYSRNTFQELIQYVHNDCLSI